VLQDARRFIQENFEVIDSNCLETYRSALVWLPGQSGIRVREHSRLSQPPKIVTGRRECWDACEAVIPVQSAALSVAFSPGGKHIAIGAYSKDAGIWNFGGLSLERKLDGHDDSVKAVAFSSNGDFIVTGSHDNTVRIWATSTGNCELILDDNSDWVNCVAFLPGDKRVISGSDDCRLRMWDITSIGELDVTPTIMPLVVLEGHRGPVRTVSATQDGRIVSGSDDCTVRVWRIDGSHSITLEGHTKPVTTVATSPQIMSGSADQSVRIWDVVKGACLFIIRTPSCINCLSAFGTRIVTGHEDGLLRISKRDNSEGLTLGGHMEEVTDVKFSLDGSFIASASSDGTVKLWSPGGNFEPEPSGSPINAASFSEDGSQVMTSTSLGLVQVWRVDDGRLLRALSSKSTSIDSVAFSKGGSYIIAGSSDGLIRIWGPESDDVIYDLEGHTGPIWSVNFSKDGLHTVTGGEDGRITIWNSVTGQRAITWVGHSKGVNSVIFSPDGTSVVSASYDYTICVWEATTGKLQNTLIGHKDWVRSVCFAADSALIISGSHDCTVRVWNGEQLLSTLRQDGSKINSVTMSNDGTLIITGSDDGTVRVWDIATGQCDRLFKDHSDAVNCVSVSCNESSSLVIASGGKDLKLRKLDSLSHTLEHEGRVWSAAFSADGTRIVSGSDDSAVRVWNVKTGQIEHVLKGHSSAVWSVAFSITGKIASASNDHTVRLWDGTGEQSRVFPWVTLPDRTEVEHKGIKGFNIPAHNNIIPRCRYRISESRDWIMYDNKPVWWIPAALRNYVTHIWRGTVLCLGYGMGRVMIVHFNPETDRDDEVGKGG
jgi:WD40 repeat protein